MTPFVNDPDFQLHVGDALEVLATLPDESVHCCVTSPPYWGLRAYLDDDHPDKQHEMGLEASPDEFVARMVAVFREVRRVLRADGTCWVNLGDSYANDTKWGGSTGGKHAAGLHDAAGGLGRGKRETGLKAKDLVGIPWRVAFALQADGWYLRSDIVWSKPNPMPESVTDRPTKAHEYVFLLTRSPRYFFDQEAVREPHTPDGRSVTNVHKGNGSIQHRDGERWPNGGRNVRSVWEIATQPYPEAHFATFPEALPERCIRAGTSERGCCPKCGAPWEREVGRGVPAREVAPSGLDRYGTGEAGVHRKIGGQYQKWLDENPLATTGWAPSCLCLDRPAPGEGRLATLGMADGPFAPVPCTVLDPFMGSGTTALVARRLGRRSIGIELNPEYAELCARRLQQLSLFAGEPA